MSNYIKSELYRIFHNVSTYMFIGICSALLISSNVVLSIMLHLQPDFPYGNTAFSISNFVSSLSFVFILCISVSSIVFGNEHTNHTLKNSVSYGISRGTIYFSKLIVEIIYALIAFAVITGFHVTSAFLLLEHSNENELLTLLNAFIACLPLFLFVLAATNCFSFIVESSGSSISANVGLLLAFPMICSLLGMKFDLFRKLSVVLPWNVINRVGVKMHPLTLVLPWEGNAGFYNSWLAGMIQMVMIMIIGYIVFSKKEIK